MWNTNFILDFSHRSLSVLYRCLREQRQNRRKNQKRAKQKKNEEKLCDVWWDEEELAAVKASEQRSSGETSYKICIVNVWALQRREWVSEWETRNANWIYGFGGSFKNIFYTLRFFPIYTRFNVMPSVYINTVHCAAHTEIDCLFEVGQQHDRSNMERREKRRREMRIFIAVDFLQSLLVAIVQHSSIRYSTTRRCSFDVIKIASIDRFLLSLLTSLSRALAVNKP